MTTPNIPGAAPTPAKNGRKTADQQPKRDHRAAVQAHKLRMNLAITALRFGKYEPVMKPRSPMIFVRLGDHCRHFHRGMHRWGQAHANVLKNHHCGGLELGISQMVRDKLQFSTVVNTDYGGGL